VFASFFALFLPIPVILLATLAGIVQALVFGALVTAYISTVAPEEETLVEEKTGTLAH
jgi:F0F1-type ATP synthase membrane subunit a